MMDYLRTQSVQENQLHPDAKPILSFHKSFLDSIKFTGRLYEVGLIAAFKARTFRITQDLTIAPAMYLKGKLPIIPERIRDRRGMKRIFAQTIENPKKAHS
ncbi:MAG: hypothetical protein LWW85_09420 [Marinilabiliales bacterium]|nr:hypothetical protein [Marinilabiliales bacterium]